MVKWGIIELGNIAARFAKSLQKSNEGILYAVASRNSNKSKKFAANFNAKKAYDNYEDLLNDENIDVVYIALPHDLHKEWEVNSLKKKKGVLCEKPVTLCAKEMIEIQKAAIENKAFFMEAMKTRFLPAMEELKKVISEGIIGDLIGIEANFCWESSAQRTSYLYDPIIGGAILDVRIYPLSFVMDINRRNIVEVKTNKVIHNNIVTSFISKIKFENGVEAIIEKLLLIIIKKEQQLLKEV